MPAGTQVVLPNVRDITTPKALKDIVERNTLKYLVVCTYVICVNTEGEKTN